MSDKYLGTSSDISMADVVSKLTEKGYKIEQVSAAGSSITGISLDNSSISISSNETATITVTYEGSSDGESYYAVIDGKYYKMTLTDSGITIDKTASEIDNTPTITETLTATSSDETQVKVESIEGNVITLTGGSTAGSATITVTYGSYSKTCEVSIVVKPNESGETDTSTTFSTAYGTIDVIWLSGTTNEVATTPNAPNLTSNEESMTPVSWTYDETAGTWSEDTETQSTWYSYTGTGDRNAETNALVDNTSSKWANAKTTNGSYFVWIPRYAYRITYYESQTSTTPTGYYDGYGMWNATDGTVKYALESGIETVEHNGNKYIVHPAFETNLDLGGWSSDLTGFWFAKYEMSGSGSTSSSSSNLKSVPGVSSLRSTTIGNQYRYARNANYGYTGTIDTITSNGTEYTHTSYMNSHLVKNSEWGAVAYLTQSKYGRNGNEITINSSSSYYTGGGSGTAYLTNTAQSTTGNVYGIYDMSGNAYEYSASFDKLGSSTYVAGSSYGLYMTKEAKDSSGNYISTKYVTAYSNGTSTNSGTTIYTVGKTGDSTKEVYLGSGKTGWFLDYSSFARSSVPFFIRGGTYDNGSGAGVFTSSSSSGGSYSNSSFRVVLAQ